MCTRVCETQTERARECVCVFLKQVLTCCQCLELECAQGGHCCLNSQPAALLLGNGLCSSVSHSNSGAGVLEGGGGVRKSGPQWRGPSTKHSPQGPTQYVCVCVCVPYAHMSVCVGCVCVRESRRARESGCALDTIQGWIGGGGLERCGFVRRCKRLVDEMFTEYRAD